MGIRDLFWRSFATGYVKCNCQKLYGAADFLSPGFWKETSAHRVGQDQNMGNGKSWNDKKQNPKEQNNVPGTKHNVKVARIGCHATLAEVAATFDDKPSS